MTNAPGPALTNPPPHQDGFDQPPPSSRFEPQRGERASARRPSRGLRPGKLVLGAALLGLVVWIGSRIGSAMEDKAKVTEARDAVAAKAKEALQQPRQVRVVRGVAGTAVPSVSFEGTLQAVEQADLGFKVSGRLARLGVAVGDKVKRGTVLAQLDASEAAAQVKAAEAALRAAEAQLLLATDSEARTQRVVSQGVQPESFGVQAAQQKALAEAQRDGASAQLLLSRQNLGNHAIVAPFDGTVTKAPEGPGGVVSPGVPLFHVADLSRLKLVGSVSAADAELVRPDAKVEVLADGRAVAEGKITAVVAALDDATKRLPVQAIIDNGESTGLIAGTLVRARVAGTEPLPVLRLPHTVLKPGSQDEVLVVEGDALVVRHITFDVADDGSLLVRKGVVADDAVVAAPWPEAKTGDVVRSAP